MKSFAVAFKSVYEKGLMKYGFKKIKGSRLYYVRCVGDEIVHVIAVQDAFTPKQDSTGIFHKAFWIVFGVATVYRKEIQLNVLPKDNQLWLNKLSDICYTEHYCSKYDRKACDEIIPRLFEYHGADEDAMMEVIRKSFELTEKYALPVLDHITTLEECLKHFFKYNPIAISIKDASDRYIQGEVGGKYNEGLVCTLVYESDRIKEYENAWIKVYQEANEDELYYMNAGMSGITIEEHSKNETECEKKRKDKLILFDMLANTPECQEKIRRELEQRKSNNIEILRNCGLEL